MKHDIAGRVAALAPPGAGLPGPELIIARWLVRWGRWHYSRGRASEVFTAERVEILRRVRGLGDEAASQRVLIPRLRGLEDSSRCWSVYMTLDHLRIVNDACSGTIGMLLAGRVPGRPASTAAVKPCANPDRSVVVAFDEACQRFERTVAAAPDRSLATPVTHAHPWFGPLDAAGWHFMAGFHMNLHRRQIERILQEP